MQNKKSLSVSCIPALAFLMIFGMVAAAELLHEKEIIFPEIAALVTGAWLCPNLPWRVGKVKAVLLLTLLSVVGVCAVRFLPLPLAVKLPIVLIFAAVCLFFSRCTLLPILSACVLPVLMGTESIVYPISVFVMSCLIFGFRFVLERIGWRKIPAETRVVPSVQNECLRWCMILVIFLPLCFAAIVSGWLFLIAPPLLVTFAEFTYVDSPVRSRELRVFFVIVLCAVVGAFGRLLLCEIAGLPLLLCTAVILLLCYLIFRVSDCLFPPAGALALLPLIIAESRLTVYPLAVAIGAAVMITAAHFIRVAVYHRGQCE